jgi:hypothetical protein
MCQKNHYANTWYSLGGGGGEIVQLLSQNSPRILVAANYTQYATNSGITEMAI